MIIHKAIVTDERDEVCVSAPIEIRTAGVEVPETLWFRFPKRYREFVSDRADAFLVGLLPSAMSLGEALRVEGPVSPRLAHGVREYQYAQHAWWPERFSVVETAFAAIEPPKEGKGRAVGCTLSGGVDSFYTLWQHLPHNEPLPEYRLTHALMINGFDFDDDIEQTGRFERTREVYAPLVDELGLELVVCRNNLRRFRLAAQRKAPLFLSLESPIAASVLVLSHLFHHFYIAGSGSYRYESLYPKGAHPAITHCLGTEYLEFITDGCNTSRVGKTAAIARWPKTYENLRVCWRETVFDERTGRVENCGRCDKCIRTMLALELLGELSKYKTFPPRIRRRDIWRGTYVSRASLVFYNDIKRLARKKHRRDRVLDLLIARLRSRFAALARRVRRRIIGR